MPKIFRLPDHLIEAIGDKWPFSPFAISLQCWIDRLTRFRASPVKVWHNDDGSRTWIDRRGFVYGSDC